VTLNVTLPADGEKGPAVFELDPKTAFTVVVYGEDRRIREIVKVDALDRTAVSRIVEALRAALSSKP
jgi:hypothetical protein